MTNSRIIFSLSGHEFVSINDELSKVNNSHYFMHWMPNFSKGKGLSMSVKVCMLVDHDYC